MLLICRGLRFDLRCFENFAALCLISFKLLLVPDELIVKTRVLGCEELVFCLVLLNLRLALLVSGLVALIGGLVLLDFCFELVYFDLVML